jgi:hypothetical protein
LLVYFIIVFTSFHSLFSIHHARIAYHQAAVSKFNQDTGSFACLLLSAPACRFFAAPPGLPIHASASLSGSGELGGALSPSPPAEALGQTHLAAVTTAILFDSHWNPRTDTESMAFLLPA